MTEKRISRKVRVRNLVIGGGAPVSIQSMTNADSRNAEAVLTQVRRLQDAGCEIVRIAVPDQESLEAFRAVRKQTDLPLVADIHFDYRLAIGAIRAGADKVRINPGNIGSEERLRAVAECAKAYGVPIRVGVNSGSLEKEILRKYGHVTPEALAESALRNAELVERMGWDQIVVSLKASDVRMNYEASRIFAEKTDYPLHIGVTEAGTLSRGKIKSAAGLGALLLAGIGDTMRVSLTADPVEEVRFARMLLEAVGLREPKFDLVSCPTCGRTRIDLEGLAEEVERRLAAETELPAGLRVAVMGCVVNGPGEAKEADYGVCGGDGKGIVISKGEILETVPEQELADTLIRVIRRREGISEPSPDREAGGQSAGRGQTAKKSD